MDEIHVMDLASALDVLARLWREEPVGEAPSRPERMERTDRGSRTAAVTTARRALSGGGDRAAA
jgi:hypothetical protein